MYAESHVVMYVHMQKPHAMRLQMTAEAQAPMQATARCFTVVLNFPIAFSTSLEGSVIEMKPASTVPVDTAVSLKAYVLAKFHHNF